MQISSSVLFGFGLREIVDLPWDSIKSRFASQNPLDQRVSINYQGGQPRSLLCRAVALTDVFSSGPSYRIWVTTGTVYTNENGGSLY